MAKAELGTKRICPDTGKKFFDLNKNPVVSPYSGSSWPRSYFEEVVSVAVVESEPEDEAKEVDTENNAVELVSLEVADGDSTSDNLPDVDGDDDVNISDDDDDTFLETDDDDDDDDVIGIVNVTGDDDDN